MLLQGVPYQNLVARISFIQLVASYDFAFRLLYLKLVSEFHTLSKLSFDNGAGIGILETYMPVSWFCIPGINGFALLDDLSNLFSGIQKASSDFSFLLRLRNQFLG